MNFPYFLMYNIVYNDYIPEKYLEMAGKKDD